MKYLIAILMIALVLLPSCGSTPDTERAAENYLASGAQADSKATTGDKIIPIAGSYFGDAENAPVTAKADRTTSSTGTFRQHAFDFAGTVAATGAAYAEVVDKDPVLVELRAELAALRASPDSTPEARAAVLDRITARTENLQGMLGRAGGGDLSALTHLTVVNTATNSGNAGHETRPLTTEEANAASTAIPNAIREARKKP